MDIFIVSMSFYYFVNSWAIKCYNYDRISFLFSKNRLPSCFVCGKWFLLTFLKQNHLVYCNLRLKNWDHWVQGNFFLIGHQVN